MRWEECEERERMYACWLCNFPTIGNRQLFRLTGACGGAEGVYFAGKEKWRNVLSEKQVQELTEYTARWRPEAEYRRMRETGIGLVTALEAGYPERLKNIPDAPFRLFFRGRMPKEDRPAVAVIGARDCSEYGRYVAKILGEVLGKRGIAVISGMARGIDGISQDAALRAGGYSVGVLGCGADVCYPTQNKNLYEKLTESGAVISEYPLGTPPRPQNFPPRNRIVSGLADVVAVIEAGVKSGTLITVDMALEQGREVYAVPGRVTDRLSGGCNRLIRQGAGVTADPESFAEEVWQLWEMKRGMSVSGGRNGGIGTGRKEAESTEKSVGKKADDPRGDDGNALSAELEEICGALDFYPKTVEEIEKKLSGRYGGARLTARLMRLCVEGEAVQVSPGHFCLRGG